MEVRTVLATNIRTLMKHTEIQSQAQLASMAGISQAQVGNILHQKTGVSIDVIHRLASALDVEVWVLLTPVSFLEDLGNLDPLPILSRYMRLGLSAQDAVWTIVHELYEATGGYFK